MDKIGKISIAAAEDENTMRRMQQNQLTIPADISRGIQNQPTIPAGISRDILETVKRAAATNYLEAVVLGTKKENSNLVSGTTDIMRAHSRSINAVQLRAGRRIDGIRRNQEQIARQLASIQGGDHAQVEDADRGSLETAPTATLERVRTRLLELEQISKDINKNIDHIDAVVAIKDNYLHQLRTAETLLARYNAAQTSGDDDQMDQAEIFHAAYTVIMHNVPRRYNPEANNKDGHETIAQVIARLETEVADLNAKAAEEGFEVGLEMALLNEIQSDPNIDAETLDNKANQAVDRYVKTMRDAGALVSMEDGTLEIIKRGVIKKIENYSGLASDDNLEEANVLNFTPKTLAVNTSEPLDAFDISSLPIDAASEILDDKNTTKDIPKKPHHRKVVKSFGDINELVDRGDDPEASYTFNPNKFKL